MFEDYESLNASLDEEDALRQGLSEAKEFKSYNDVVDEIFARLDDIEITDLSYFGQDDIRPYVTFIEEYGEPSLVPTINSKLVGSVLNADKQIIVGDELLEIGLNTLRRYSFEDLDGLAQKKFIEEQDVQLVERSVSHARANLDECSAGWRNDRKQRVVGKIGTTNIFGGKRNDFTIKNQKKRWYGWTDYSAKKLFIDGDITYDLFQCVIDVDGVCKDWWIFLETRSGSVYRSWYDTRRETANVSINLNEPGLVVKSELKDWGSISQAHSSYLGGLEAECTCEN